MTRKAKAHTRPASDHFAAALRYYQAGKLDDAEQACRAALRNFPGHAESLHLRGVIASRRGTPDIAADLIRRAIAANENAAPYHNSLGNALQMQGQRDDAIACYRTAITLNPGFAQAHANLGSALSAAGQSREAIAHYQQAIALKPDFLEVINNLGNLFRTLGRFDEAIACHRRAIEVRPDCAEAHNNLGNELQESGALEAAIACHCKAIELQPNFAAAYYNLGNALQAQGDCNKAVVCYRHAILLQPNEPEAHTNLGNALHAAGLMDDAVASHRRAIALRPDYVEAFNNLGNALREQGQLHDAIACHRTAIELQPDFAAAHSNLGNELEELGQLDAARAAHRRAIALAPRCGSFYHRLANAGGIGADDELATRMEELAADAARLPAPDCMELHFALAIVHTRRDPERAFRHLLAANRLKRACIAYDEAATLAMFARLRAVFTAARLATPASAGTPSTLPVFVVGMPRSGTTLVEQILASHPQVFGAGECADLPRLLGALEPPGGQPFPEAIDLLPPDAMARLGAAYVEGLRARAAEAARIVDKLPGNFMRIGFIHLALPQAKIIHVQRDPVDTCLSCFSKLFSGNLPYAYDLAELGRYHRAYQALMQHWRNVLPPGIMLDVRYEDLIADLPAQTRRMLDHCALPWDDRCLAFHDNRRPVQTYSANQVRQKLYGSAVGKWHIYRDLAQPLLDALALGAKHP